MKARDATSAALDALHIAEAHAAEAAKLKAGSGAGGGGAAGGLNGDDSAGSAAAAAAAAAARKLADARALAAKLRREAALKAAQEAHAEWQRLMNRYNMELQRLKEAQDSADRIGALMEKAANASKAARALYMQRMKEEAQANAEVARLAQAASASSNSAAAATSLGEAGNEEMAALARAAQHRLMIAKGATKDALGKLLDATDDLPASSTSETLLEVRSVEHRTHTVRARLRSAKAH